MAAISLQPSNASQIVGENEPSAAMPVIDGDNSVKACQSTDLTRQSLPVSSQVESKKGGKARMRKAKAKKGKVKKEQARKEAKQVPAQRLGVDMGLPAAGIHGE